MTGATLINDIKINGFAIIEDIYTEVEIDNIVDFIEQVPSNTDTFRKTADVFAIRQFLKEVPFANPVIFNQKLLDVITQNFGPDYFVNKAIYFDKPAQSNWFVACHQDLTIAVDKKADLESFGPWTVKLNQFAVQPPLPILQNNFTIRIHLDDTGVDNGALRVVPGSHEKGIYRAETIDWDVETEITCPVKKGGIMIMKPLLLHASNRTTNNKSRRVIHLEFSNAQLPAEINWSEKYQFQKINEQKIQHPGYLWEPSA